MGFALLWLPASEAALIAYTMPVWASILAWPILGERPNLLRVISLVMAFARAQRHPGRQWLCGEPVQAAGNHHGARRRDRFCGRRGSGQETADHTCRRCRPRPGRSGSAACRWRSSGLAIEKSSVAGFSGFDWMLLGYSTVVQFCVAYVCWFAALARLPASVAAIGTMAVPVIGVVASSRRAARAARHRPDRSAGVHAGGRGAGDAILTDTHA